MHTNESTCNFAYNRVFVGNNVERSFDREQIRQTPVVKSNANCSHVGARGFMKAVPDCGENITAVDYDAKVHVINDIIVKSVKSNLYFRSRLQFKELDKEPSRVSLRKVMHSLKIRKLRVKVTNVLRDSVPVSFDLHNIAIKDKWCKTRHAERQTNFFSKYFFQAKMCNCCVTLHNSLAANF